MLATSANAILPPTHSLHVDLAGYPSVPFAETNMATATSTFGSCSGVVNGGLCFFRGDMRICTMEFRTSRTKEAVKLSVAFHGAALPLKSQLFNHLGLELEL